jgi:hypothetical protein
MSTPEEIQSETQPDQPMDMAAAVRQLRLLVCGLGAALIFVSLVLSAFVIKQNRDLAAVTNNREHQLAQMQGAQRSMMIALNELAKYSVGKPELAAIFTKHGLKYSPTTVPERPASPPQR